MASTKSKLIKKSTRSDLITYAMVLVVFAVVEILKSTGNISSLLRGLWFLCVCTPYLPFLLTL